MSDRRTSVMRCVRWGLVLGAVGVIAFFALRRSPYLQYIPWMPRGVGVWADSHGILRNVAAFLVLALLAFVLLGRRRVVLIGLSLFATGVEVAQLGIRGRVFDWRDIVASLAGVLLAWAIAWLLRVRTHECSNGS